MQILRPLNEYNDANFTRAVSTLHSLWCACMIFLLPSGKFLGASFTALHAHATHAGRNFRALKEAWTAFHVRSTSEALRRPQYVSTNTFCRCSNSCLKGQATTLCKTDTWTIKPCTHLHDWMYKLYMLLMEGFIWVHLVQLSIHMLDMQQFRMHCAGAVSSGAKNDDVFRLERLQQ